MDEKQGGKPSRFGTDRLPPPPRPPPSARLPPPPGHHHARRLAAVAPPHPTRQRDGNALKVWWNSPDAKRKKRVARYKLYAMEGKVKSSLKKSCRWVKQTCSRIIHGC
ncbi:unnamed protein product [Linum trigynum]|uniref:Uncharacterized protein n=1 Tax=Linum trigynum TaxID=586398 RepID=A0AAV2GAX8_9ROSI